MMLAFDGDAADAALLKICDARRECASEWVPGPPCDEASEATESRRSSECTLPVVSALGVSIEAM
jgi:hypothetical protein